LKPGTGLGLAIVRDVADVYGGRTWIGDSGLGGAAVYIELPARSSAAH
jgi:signal transduction histidine kinase